MAEFKRNQVEEAISRVLDSRSAEPPPELRIRLKRLLETDRALGRTPRASDPARANYAFYSVDAQGSGVEVWFSGYEAFSLFNGLRLMMHGWPQGFAVSVMRRVRVDLEREHARVLKLDPAVIFDQEAIRRNAKEGDLAFESLNPVFLTIVTKSRNAADQESEPLGCEICRGPEKAMKWAWQRSKGTGGFTLFELVKVAHDLAEQLQRTTPRSRGRG